MRSVVFAPQKITKSNSSSRSEVRREPNGLSGSSAGVFVCAHLEGESKLAGLPLASGLVTILGLPQ